MITPIEIQKTEFKTGMHGYSTSQVDEFKDLILKDYENLYRQNLDMSEQIEAMEEKIEYYSSIEKSLHKALILAEKSAEDTKNSANLEAEKVLTDAKLESEKMLTEAKLESETIVSNAKTQLNDIYNATINLLKQYNTYKAQIIAASTAQTNLMSSEAFIIDETKLDAYLNLIEKDN